MHYPKKRFFLEDGLICQDQIAPLILPVEAISRASIQLLPGCETYMYTVLQTAGTLEADCFPLPALPPKCYSSPKVPAVSDAFSGSSCLSHIF